MGEYVSSCLPNQKGGCRLGLFGSGAGTWLLLGRAHSFKTGGMCGRPRCSTTGDDHACLLLAGLRRGDRARRRRRRPARSAVAGRRRRRPRLSPADRGGGETARRWGNGRRAGGLPEGGAEERRHRQCELPGRRQDDRVGPDGRAGRAGLPGEPAALPDKTEWLFAKPASACLHTRRSSSPPPPPLFPCLVHLAKVGVSNDHCPPACHR